MDDVAPNMEEALSLICDGAGVSPELARPRLEQFLGIDFAEISDDDAEDLIEAHTTGDAELLADVFERYDVRPEAIEQFNALWEETADQDISEEEVVEKAKEIRDDTGDAGDTDETDGEETGTETDETDRTGGVDPGSPGSSAGVTEADVRRIARQEMPDATEIAAKLKQDLQQDQQVPEQAQPQPQQGGLLGLDEATQAELAQMAAKQFIQHMNLGQSDESELAEMEKQWREGMYKSLAQQAQSMAQPSIGQRVGERIDEQVTDEIISNIRIDISGDGADEGIAIDRERNAEADD